MRFSSVIYFSGCTLAIILLVSSCAKKPWGVPFDGDQLAGAKAEVSRFLVRDKQCGPTLSADLTLFYQDPIDKRALKGYLDFSLPKDFKFIVTNPFGQPLMILAGNRKTYEVILTRETQFIAGSLESFALRHNLPLEFINGNWGEWLTGRCLMPPSSIIEIGEDLSGRGLWVEFSSVVPSGLSSSVLFDRASGEILIRRLKNKDGNTIAMITYGERTARGQNNCRQPGIVDISELGYGTTIQLKFENIEIQQEKKEYDIKAPTGYFQKYLP